MVIFVEYTHDHKTTERKEIEDLIAQLKRELVIYQRRAEKMKVEDAQIEAQIDKFLESIQVLMEILKKKK